MCTTMQCITNIDILSFHQYVPHVFAAHITTHTLNNFISTCNMCVLQTSPHTLSTISSVRATCVCCTHHHTHTLNNFTSTCNMCVLHTSPHTLSTISPVRATCLCCTHHHISPHTHSQQFHQYVPHVCAAHITTHTLNSFNFRYIYNHLYCFPSFNSKF